MERERNKEKSGEAVCQTSKKICPRCGEPMNYHIDTYKIFANDFSGSYIVSTDEYYECAKCGCIKDFSVNRTHVMSTSNK